MSSEVERKCSTEDGTIVNQEDSVIINQSAIDRGLFRSFTFHTNYVEEKKRQDGQIETIQLPPKEIRQRNLNYSKLDPSGLIYIGESVEENDVIVGKVIERNGKLVDCSLVLRKPEVSHVDKIVMTTNSQGYKMVKIRLRYQRIPIIGDKFATRQSQKGTVGMTYRQEDMPYTLQGIVPDVILNVHCLPSRMTINTILEILLSKSGVLEGKFQDGTSFQQVDTKHIENVLTEYGYERHGEETMHNGFTGEMFKAKIFIGPIYYQRLKHMVTDKIHCLTMDHEVLTRTGWKYFDSLTKDDEIASVKNGRMVYMKPKNSCISQTILDIFTRFKMNILISL